MIEREPESPVPGMPTSKLYEHLKRKRAQQLADKRKHEEEEKARKFTKMAKVKELLKDLKTQTTKQK